MDFTELNEHEEKTNKEYLILNPNLDGSNLSNLYSFKFNKVLPEKTNQKELYEVVGRPVVERVLSGYNGTVLAFGQTGTGKTHTIIGDLQDRFSIGLIPRIFHDIFSSFETQSKEYKYSLCASFLEIYNEVCYDLLPFDGSYCFNDTSEECPYNRVNILEDADGYINVTNLTKHYVHNMNEVYKYLRLSLTNRVTAGTSENMDSSRSHFILTIFLKQIRKNDNVTINSKLHIVDLAGSERLGKRNSCGWLSNETKYINLSLHFLQQVIVALNEAKRPHIPYRNSLLTLLLRDSLGGNCCTAMIFNISLHSANFDESVTTCRFAQRVSLVKNAPRIVIEYEAINQLNKLKKEADELSSLMMLNGEVKGVFEKNNQRSDQQSISTISNYSNNKSEENINISQEYLEHTINHINRGIKLLSTLLKEIPSLRIREANTQNEYGSYHKLINKLGLDLPEQNPFTGEVYCNDQRARYKDFLHMASTNRALNEHLGMNISYYKYFEKEWRLWNKEKMLLEKIREIEQKLETAKEFGDFPDEIQNLTRKCILYRQKYSENRLKWERIKDTRKNSMKMFLDAKNKLLGTFEVWWKRKKFNDLSMKSTFHPNNTLNTDERRNFIDINRHYIDVNCEDEGNESSFNSETSYPFRSNLNSTLITSNHSTEKTFKTKNSQTSTNSSRSCVNPFYSMPYERNNLAECGVKQSISSSNTSYNGPIFNSKEEDGTLLAQFKKNCTNSPMSITSANIDNLFQPFVDNNSSNATVNSNGGFHLNTIFTPSVNTGCASSPNIISPISSVKNKSNEDDEMKSTCGPLLNYLQITKSLNLKENKTQHCDERIAIEMTGNEELDSRILSFYKHLDSLL